MAPDRPTGTLFVVATPLGNLEDLSPRALRVLREVACIACEDTRRTAKLLARYGVDTATVACHRFNERERIEPILERLRSGEDVALVSDGGTPCLSDPGSLLVAAVVAAGLGTVPVPGPFAAAALLSVVGFPVDRFVFEGFLPHRAGERRRRIRDLREETRPIVLYEAPHRLRATLDDLAAILGGRALVLGREMTKIHESILRGSAAEIGQALGDAEVRGECTLVVAGRGAAEEDAAPTGDDDRNDRVRGAWDEALRECRGDRREGLRLAARRLGMRRPELFRLLQEIGALEG
jgi:16S rRNA (cytidine1402-2'-O)-methyltransferase